MAKKFLSYAEKAKYIIDNQNYMVLATSDKHSKPWASPLFYVYDNSYNFYFLSAIDSRHIENLMANPEVGIAIFDSSQKIGSSDGLQMEGKASMIGKDDVKKVIGLYSERLFPNSKITPEERYNPEQYVEPAEFRFFKVVPTTVYVTGVDRRDEVDLKQ